MQGVRKMPKLEEMRLWFAGTDEETWGYPVQYVDIEIAVHAGISSEAPFGTKLWSVILNSDRWSSDALTQEDFLPDVEVGTGFTIVVTPVKPTANGPSVWNFDWFLLTMRRGVSHESIEYGYSLDGPSFYTPNASFRVYLQFNEGTVIQTNQVSGQSSHVVSYQYSTNLYTAQTNFAGVLAPLDKPINPVPGDYVEPQPSTLTRLEWDCLGEPDEYEIEVEAWDSDWELVYSSGVISTGTNKFFDLPAGSLTGAFDVAWTVRAVYGERTASSSWGFEVFEADPPPKNPTPSDEAEDVDVEIEKLEWECDGEPDEYRVYLTEQGEDLIHVGTTTEKEFSLEKVPPQYLKMETTYEWTVSAVYDGTEVFPEGHEE